MCEGGRTVHTGRVCAHRSDTNGRLLYWSEEDSMRPVSVYRALLSSDNSSATSSVEALAPYGRTLHNRERWTQSTVTRHARIFDVRHAVASKRVHSAALLYPELPKSKPLCARCFSRTRPRSGFKTPSPFSHLARDTGSRMKIAETRANFVAGSNWTFSRLDLFANRFPRFFHSRLSFDSTTSASERENGRLARFIEIA